MSNPSIFFFVFMPSLDCASPWQNKNSLAPTCKQSHRRSFFVCFYFSLVGPTMFRQTVIIRHTFICRHKPMTTKRQNRELLFFILLFCFGSLRFVFDGPLCFDWMIFDFIRPTVTRQSSQIPMFEPKIDWPSIAKHTTKTAMTTILSSRDHNVANAISKQIDENTTEEKNKNIGICLWHRFFFLRLFLTFIFRFFSSVLVVDAISDEKETFNFVSFSRWLDAGCWQ